MKLARFFDQNNRQRALCGLSFLCLALTGGANLFGQREIAVVREFQIDGFLQSLIGDEMTVVAADGKQYKLRIQARSDQPIGLSGGDLALNELADIKVRGAISSDVLREGMVVALQCTLQKDGKLSKIESAELLPLDAVPEGITVQGEVNAGKSVNARIVGRIKSLNKKRMVLSVPRHEFAPRQTITFAPSAVTEWQYQTSSLRALRTGDVVDRLAAAELSTGDSVVRQIQITMVEPREDLNLSIDEQLSLKYRDESDELPESPQQWESPERHYRLTADISERQAKMLMDKLEAMYGLLTVYYGRRPNLPIEVFVVDDPGKWDLSEWDPRVIRKVLAGEGITVYRRLGANQQAVVFSANRPDVVQHEAVHGFCYLTFQGTGPLWYAEGMAEMGQYWKADDVAVSANPAVIGYLRSRKPESLNSIINATRIEGELWKAYAWRWALCHLLANNPNYAKVFRRLGPALMKETPKASFENTYRKQADELIFEYKQFMAHLETGLRADLIAWQWDDKAKPVGSKTIQQVIQSARGWQSTGAIVEKGVTYETRCQGDWKHSPASPAVDANGEPGGNGKLIGVILKEFQLSEEFELGVEPDFTANADGVLYVRCQERLSQIADNEGEVNFAIRKKK